MKFDEGTGSSASDSSLYDNDGTITGATWTSSGIDDDALDYDGTDDVVTITNNPSLQIAGDLTLSFWIKPHDLGNARENPLDKSYGGEFALTLENDPNKGRLRYYHGTSRSSGAYYWGWTALDNNTVKDNIWQHIVITRNTSNDSMKSYYNGNLMKETTYDTAAAKLPSTSTYDVTVGNGYTNVFFDGIIDEVKIYNRALDSNEVVALYDEFSGGAGKRAAPYPFDEIIINEIQPKFNKIVQVRPNPFKNTTVLNYEIIGDDNIPVYTKLQIFNIKGNLIKILVNDYMENGNYSVEWDGKNRKGQSVKRGIYYYMLEVGDKQETGTLTNLKR